MNALETRLVGEVIECLEAIVASGLEPADALRRLRGVGGDLPQDTLDLVWDDDADGQGRHYDALLRLAQGGTLSISYCPLRALPWPLRGAHRFDDADLLRVNDCVLTVGQAIGQIDAMLEDRTISTRLVDACLVNEELARHPVQVSTSELQRTMDAFRRTHRLYTVEACQDWMTRRGLSAAQFEQLVADHAQVAVLRRRVTADDVAALDADTREDATHELFAQWLDGRRQSARIEWFWHEPR